DLPRAVDHLHVRGSLTGRALDLLVTVVTDQQDVVVVAGETLGLVVHLGHQRAGRIDGAQLAVLGRLAHRRRGAVGGEDHQFALGHLVGLVDEDHALFGQGVDHVTVVHDLFSHIDRRTLLLERAFDRFHGPIHTGAVTPRLGEQDTLFHD